MSLIHEITRAFIAVGATDLRKSYNGLSMIVAEDFELELFTGDLFAFCNRRKNRIKILYWDRNGFCIWQKRLEKENFLWPKYEKDVLEISSDQMSWLLAGLDIGKAHKQLNYKSI